MKDGHTCRIATHLEYKDWVESHGIEFREVKGNPAALMQLCVENGMFTYAFLKEALTSFKGWVEELLESAWIACRGTDLIIESPSAMAGVHIAEKLGIPFFGAFTMPWTRTKNYPHPFAVPERNLGYGYNYMSHVLIEQVYWKGTSGLINKWRKNILDRPSINLGALNDHKIPFLYNFSNSIVPKPSDWQEWIDISGYWFLDNPEVNWTPPQSLTDFLNAGPKPVYIGFGSIVVSDPEGLTDLIVKAVQKAGVRAILSKGWSGRLNEKKDNEEYKYPDCIYPLDKVPHDWLFPQVAGVVHHGGAGTTSAGLRAGVPTIIKPFFGDQYFWADRVVDMGVGLSIRKLSVNKLASKLKRIVSDKKMQEKARIIGEKIRSEDGVQNSIQFIYKNLDFASERINELAKSVDNSASWKFNSQILYRTKSNNNSPSIEQPFCEVEEGAVESSEDETVIITSKKKSASYLKFLKSKV